MINILLYGNCQVFGIWKTLVLPTEEYTVQHIYCFSTDYDCESFTNIIKKCDIIVTQAIQDNYKDVEYLSTNYIIKNSNNDCKIIIFDSCHFDFYYFDLTYRCFNNSALATPSDYHYNKMIECYTNNKSVEYYVENYINNENLITSEELENNAENSLNELKKRYYCNKEKYNKEKYNRENIYMISTYEFIKNNYKEKLLFYSMNHPTKYVIQYICEEIIRILQIKIPTAIDYEKDALTFTKCILYKCIQKVVSFDITQHKPFTSEKTNNYEITQLYYDAYREINYS